MILAGDIGGTKTSLAIFTPQAGPHTPLAEATFPSANYPGLEVIAQEFLSQVGLSIDSACFGVAGPIVAGQARITNLPWTIDVAQLLTTLKFSYVRLLNDLEAIASAVPILMASDLYTLNPGVPVPGGTLAVIAPGTGLGEAFLVWDGARYRAYASEGGHASFAPRNLIELEMLRYLWQQFEHVSYERVGSGMGLPNIYAYFKASGYAEELPQVAEQLAVANDPTPIIVTAALDPNTPSPLCKRTLDTFVSILGAEAGNLALKVLATGGVYLGGGIPPRILTALDNGQLMQTFRHKGRFAALLDRIPVHVILNPKAALLGAAYVGLTEMS